MPKKIRQINIFVSCPGDVEKEKKAVRDACEVLTQISDPNIQVKVIDWRKDVVPLITGACMHALPSLLMSWIVCYGIGAFIGDWIGRRRNYRLPLSP